MPYLSEISYFVFELVPSTLSINSVGGTGRNMLTLNNSGNPLNLIQYGDNNMGTQISNDPSVPSSVVPFTYLPVINF